MAGVFDGDELSWFSNVDVESEREDRINKVKLFINNYVGDEAKKKGGEGFRKEDGWDFTKLKNFIQKEYDVNSLTKMLELVNWSVYKFKSEFLDGEFLSKHDINNLEGMIYEFEKEDEMLLNVLKDEGGEGKEEVMCQVCGDDMPFDSEEWIKMNDHNHGICADCLEGYLINHSLNRGSTKIKCPHHNCDFLIDYEIVVKHAGEEAARRMKGVDCDVFVHSASDLKYCKEVGCSEVVKMESNDDWRDR